MKGFFVIAGICIIGGIVTTAVDRALGVRFEEVGFTFEVMHKAIYVAMGVVIANAYGAVRFRLPL